MRQLILLAVICLVAAGLMPTTTASAASAKAVIVVDMQGDFTTWKNGSLAVEGADRSVCQKSGRRRQGPEGQGLPPFRHPGLAPRGSRLLLHQSRSKKPFEVIEIDGRTQVLWPPHCVQDTENAKVLYDEGMFEAVVQKGKNPKFDSYSGFQDDGGEKTGMADLLTKAGVGEVIVFGLATDYCVKATAIDAADAGFKVTMVEDLSKGVAPDTSAKALEEMQAKGITVVKSLD